MMIEYLAPSLPSFPTAEYEARIAAARALMEVQQLDAMLITSEANFRYFTGDTAPAPFQITRPKFFVLPLKGEPCACGGAGRRGGAVDDDLDDRHQNVACAAAGR